MCDCCESNGRLKFRFEVLNQWGDKTVLERDVNEDYLGMGEGEIYLDVFKDFLNAAGFPMALNDKIAFVHENEAIVTLDSEDLD